MEYVDTGSLDGHKLIVREFEGVIPGAQGSEKAGHVKQGQHVHHQRFCDQPDCPIAVARVICSIELELTQVDVILATNEGEARIPARHFLENVALIIDAEESTNA